MNGKDSMRRGFLFAGLLLILSASVAFAQEATPFVAGEILVKTGRGSMLGWEVRDVPVGREKTEVSRLRGLGQKAEINGIWSTLEMIPNDTRWAEQYGPSRIRGPEAWDISVGRPEIVIAVIDTGVDCSHEDLIEKCIDGFDFVNNDSDPNDDHGHGTHVAGIASAVTNNETGIAGMCWECVIQPIKILGSNGSGSWANTALANIWAADHGAHVINMSLGGTSFSQAVKDAVDYAYSKGVVIFAAAGNTGSETIHYPAAYDAVIAVAATDSQNRRASFSTFGSFVELAAPGVSNLSSVPTKSCSLCDPSGYRSLSGTSMATPHAAGAAGVIIAHLFYGDAYSPAQVRAQMTSTALDLGDPGRDKFYGYGLVDLFAALTGELAPTPTPGTATVTPLPTLTRTPTPTRTSTATLDPSPTPTATFTEAPECIGSPESNPAPIYDGFEQSWGGGQGWSSEWSHTPLASISNVLPYRGNCAIRLTGSSFAPVLTRTFASSSGTAPLQTRMGFAATFSGPAGSNLFGICLNGSCASIGSSLIPNSYRTITIFGPAVVSGTNVVKIYTQIENPETSVFLDDLYVAWTALPTPTATSPGIPTVTTTPSATPVPIPSSTLIPSPVPTLTPTLTPVPTVTLEPTATATPEPPKEGTPICGELSGLNIWTIRGSPYFLTCDSVLGLDSVLWMQPMSALELRGFALQINGLLIAFGIRIR